MLAMCKGFSYNTFRDDCGQVTGVVWMTATMRSNFELFGHYISLDVMQRGINTHNWPYLAATVSNELSHTCVVCESVMLGEKIDAYKAVIEFVLDHAPERSRNEVYVVVGDGIFDEDTPTTFNLPNVI